jgi:hypothetical protein
VTAALAEACAGLAAWLPTAAALTALPDTDGTTGHGKPGSRPPWNAAAAHAAMDAHAGIREIEADMFYAVTGRPRRARGGSDGNTLAAIRGTVSLSASVPQNAAQDAARVIAGWVTVIQQLPAIDEAERFIKVRAQCPYCELPMLRLGERSGRVACLRYGSCFDSRGEHPTGFVSRSVSGEAFIAWADGYNQYAAVTWEDEA